MAPASGNWPSRSAGSLWQRRARVPGSQLTSLRAALGAVPRGLQVNGQHAAASPYSLYVSPSDTAIGVIVAVVLLTVAAACIIGYIVYQRRQVRPRGCCPKRARLSGH